MPKLSVRHGNADMLMFSDFTGGLNLSCPPESLTETEMRVADNFEFAPETGLLRVRQGLKLVHKFTKPVTDIIPVPRPAFQFTPLREGRQKHPIIPQEIIGFNSRPCVRGDSNSGTVCRYSAQFQFTPLREGRRAHYRAEI